MTKARYFIVQDVTTGSVRPFEIHFKAEGGTEYVVGSCKTMKNAEKALKSWIRHNKMLNEHGAGYELEA